jgi:hypothetical protein
MRCAIQNQNAQRSAVGRSTYSPSNVWYDGWWAQLQRRGRLCCGDSTRHLDELYSSKFVRFSISNFKRSVLLCIEADRRDQIRVGKRLTRPTHSIFFLRPQFSNVCKILKWITSNLIFNIFVKRLTNILSKVRQKVQGARSNCRWHFSSVGAEKRNKGRKGGFLRNYSETMTSLSSRPWRIYIHLYSTFEKKNRPIRHFLVTNSYSSTS